MVDRAGNFLLWGPAGTVSLADRLEPLPPGLPCGEVNVRSESPTKTETGDENAHPREEARFQRVPRPPEGQTPLLWGSPDPQRVGPPLCPTPTLTLYPVAPPLGWGAFQLEKSLKNPCHQLFDIIINASCRDIQEAQFPNHTRGNT